MGARPGNVYLRIEAGAAKHPGQNQWMKLGLPYGSKPRLVLMHLNAEALKQGTPLIEVEDSFTAFIRRIQDPSNWEVWPQWGRISRLQGSTHPFSGRDRQTSPVYGGPIFSGE